MSDEDFVLEKAPEVKAPELLPDGAEVPAVLVKFEKRTMPFTDDDGNPIVKVEGTFELQGDEYTFVGREGDVLQRRLYGSTSAVFNDSPYCRLRSWVMELAAMDELPEKFRFALSDFVGNECKVIVGIREYADKKAPRSTWIENIVTGEAEAPKKQINYVADVVRASYGSGASAAPAASRADEFEEEPF